MTEDQLPQATEEVPPVEKIVQEVTPVDRLSLWTILAIIFFGGFLLLFVLFNKGLNVFSTNEATKINDTNEIPNYVDEMSPDVDHDADN